VPTVVRVEIVIVVVFEAPNVAVPFGTAAGAQFAAVSKSPDPGLRSHVAFCAEAANGPSSAAKTPTNTAKRSIRSPPVHDR
jgi:hypothetical protein